MKLTSFLCPSSTPVWSHLGFSVCYGNLIFGFAADVVTLSLIIFYGTCGYSNMKQKWVKAHGFKHSLWPELLAAMAAALTLLQVFQLFVNSLEKESQLHTWLRLTFQCLAWVASCWILHKHYEVVLANICTLQIWWFIRPFFQMLILYTIIITPKGWRALDFVEELFLLILAFLFGTIILCFGWKLSSSTSSKHEESLALIEPLLHNGGSQAYNINYLEDMNGSSIWATLMFTWVTPLMDLGVSRQLSYDDLFMLPKSMDPKNCCRGLWKTWVEEQRMANGEPSLIRAIYHTYRWRYLGIGFIKIVNDSLGFAGPLLLNVIVRTLQVGSNGSLQYGYWCAFGLGVVSTLRAFMGTQYTFFISKLKLQLKASITTIVYRKALCISLSERGCFSSGEIQTLMSVDAERTVNLCSSFHELWSLPLQMVVSLCLLYMQVKFAFLAGLAVIILLIPVNRCIASRISTASKLMMKQKDERVQKMGEILMYIRTLKMYTWEKLFAQQVMKSREKELSYLGVRKYLDAWCVYFWATTPTLFSLFTFGLYALLGYTLDAATVFTSLALFNMLISPLNSFPWVINGLVEASVSLERLRRFLSCPEIHSEWTLEFDMQSNEREVTEILEEKENKTLAILIQYADFTWSHSKQEIALLALRNIIFSVPRGTLVLLTGEVGSGKSSLLEAILGEMRCLQGEMFLQGRLAYVPQIPWIQSGTIRDNILFGQPYDEERYAKILAACALDVDVERMVGKDFSFVGEHGFNLSGGQRTRLALARAIYQDCDVYLFDDPLSAVDAHVAAWLLEHAIQGPFMSNKTRLLCTYNSQALSIADTVVLMEKGSIQWSGSLHQFKDYLRGEGSHVSKMFLEHGPSHHEQSSELKLSPYRESCSNLDDKGHAKDEVEDQFSSQDSAIPLVEEEARVVGRVRAEVYWVYVTFIGWFMVVVIFISATLMQISRNGNDFWLSYWVDRTSENNEKQQSVIFYLMVLLIFAAFNSFFTLARAFSFAYGGLRAAFKVHEALLNRIVSAPIGFFDRNPRGRILNRFSSDQYAIDDSLPFISNILLANVFSVIGIIVVLCFVQWTFLIVLVPLSFIYINLQKYYRATSRELRRLDSTSRSPVYSSFTEALDGAPTIRAFKAQGLFSAQNEENVELNLRASLSEIVASLWLSIRLQMLASCVIFFISIMSFVGHHKGSPLSSATAGMVGLALSYATPIISLLSDLLTTFTETEKEMVSVERVQQYMGVEEEHNEERLQVGTDWPREGSIEFIQVTLVYVPSFPPALQNVSFSIQGGEQVGIAGRTGAGKSSILNALFQLAPLTGGKILVDGVNTADINLFQLRSRLSIVPQTPFLFEGTIRENLDPTGNATDLKLWEALEKCYLKETIVAGGGLDIHIKESGESFSFGQRQLLCLARSLLHSVKILCLDECTANVDPKTTALLKKSVALHCKGMTILTIAHRISTIMDLDRVLIFDHGKLVEEGNPQTLLCDVTTKFARFVRMSSD